MNSQSQDKFGNKTPNKIKTMKMSNFDILSEAPISEEWNEENVPIPSSSKSPAPSSSLFSKPGLFDPDTPVTRKQGLFSEAESEPDSPMFVSPANLLKRPLGTLSQNPFKRRKSLLNRSMSSDVDLHSDSDVGASPSFAVGGGPMAANNKTPKRPLYGCTTSDSSLSRNKSMAGSNAGFKYPTLKRSYSENNAAIIMKSCLLADKHPDLTGDFHQSLSLPLLKTGLKHQDLKTIDCHTMAKLIKGEFSDKVGSYRIIDARYVYEFVGGHIKGAENFGNWDPKIFFDEFLPSNKGLATLSNTNNAPAAISSPASFSIADDDDNSNPPMEQDEPKPMEQDEEEEKKRTILIFHCEFSTARGPALMRDLRKRDRCLNRESYPALHYPECYLLHNGYKEFFENYPELCDPQEYQTMADPKYSIEEKQFRKKSKSWAAGTVSRTGGTSSRTLIL